MQKCVEGEGMPIFKNNMMRGNLFINLKIVFPDSIDEKQAE